MARGRKPLAKDKTQTAVADYPADAAVDNSIQNASKLYLRKPRRVAADVSETITGSPQFAHTPTMPGVDGQSAAAHWHNQEQQTRKMRECSPAAAVTEQLEKTPALRVSPLDNDNKKISVSIELDGNLVQPTPTMPGISGNSVDKREPAPPTQAAPEDPAFTFKGPVFDELVEQARKRLNAHPLSIRED
jgi:hypothetical protein